MATGTVKRNPKWHFETVTVTLSAGNAYALIEAPTVNGYNFVCWVESASAGVIYPTYITNINQPSTSVWYALYAMHGALTFDINVSCTALYLA